MSDRVLPSGAKEKQELKSALVEITTAMQRADDEREHIKDICASCEETFGIKKAVVRKLAATMYKHNYPDIVAENEHFEQLYESVVEGKTAAP